MKFEPVVLALFLMAQPASVVAQPASPQHPPDPIAQSFFPPELVMQQQEAIGLTEVQRETIRREIKSAQGLFTDLQWSLQDEVAKLTTLLKPPRVDEARTLAQLGKVLDAEREVKKAQITLLVRIKNVLTSEQQAKLAEARHPLPNPPGR